MSPEQIHDHVERIMTRITLAYTVVENFQDRLAEAAAKTSLDPVIFGDIRSDLRLTQMRSDLRAMYNALEDAHRTLMPAHLKRLTAKRTYSTTFVNPPIPVRSSDWCACVEGQEEQGPYGWGATEDEAITDLEEKLEDFA